MLGAHYQHPPIEETDRLYSRSPRFPRKRADNYLLMIDFPAIECFHFIAAFSLNVLTSFPLNFLSSSNSTQTTFLFFSLCVSLNCVGVTTASQGRKGRRKTTEFHFKLEWNFWRIFNYLYDIFQLFQ